MEIKESVLKDGTIMYWIDCGFNTPVILVKDEGYICKVNHNHCFKRPSHDYIIKAKGITGENITMCDYYIKHGNKTA